jgi:hypothetical protein
MGGQKKKKKYCGREKVRKARKKVGSKRKLFII